MNSKERVQQALRHRTPDRIPVDFGSTDVSGIHVSCVAAMREWYGLDTGPVKVHEPYQMLGLIEDDLMEILGIDTIGLMPARTYFGFPIDNWKEWRTPWGQDVLVPGNFNISYRDGGVYMYPEGDVSAPPSGLMAEDSYFFDAIIRQPDLVETELDPQDNMEEFTLISEQELAHLKSEVDRAAAYKRAVVTGIGGTAFGDISHVPAPFLKYPKGIRDVSEWYISTVTRRDYIHAVFSGQCDIALENLQRLHQAVGNALDVLFVCGTDFGTQTSSFCSTDTFEELYAPYYRRINRWIHDHTTWKTFKHSCGAVEKFIPQFIECGFDILNPVQCSAAGMDAQMLKDRYGDLIVFWGGGVDTQNTLPFGTPAQVREQVLQRCEIFNKNGGFVFNTVHNIQAKTPVENIAALFEAIKMFNGG
ncbi:methyltransferase [candidate division KSB1 bacterium]|nr:methyltransferase [candidate division KSB1 bacterium]